MVKISIQKGKKKTIKSKPKPRQKQKQKQSQKIVVNMGKGQQKPSNTPVYIPQSNPIVMKPQTDHSMIELIKYLRESEGQKNAIAQKEPNELEKVKKDITPEDKQVYFSTVDNKTVLTPTGIVEKLKFDTLIGNTPSTKYVVPANMKSSSGPHNPMSFYDSLKQRADLLGGNPSSGQLSLSTPEPLSSPIQQINRSISTNEPKPLAHKSVMSLIDLLTKKDKPAPPLQPVEIIPEPEPAPQPILPEPEPQPEPEPEPEDEFFDMPEEEQQGEPLEVIDNSVVEEVLNDQPENQPTEAQQLIGMDSTTTPTAQRPITDISPPIHLDNIVEGAKVKPTPRPPSTPPPPLPQTNQATAEESTPAVVEINQEFFDLLMANRPKGASLKLGKILMENSVKVDGNEFGYTGKENARRVILGKKPRNLVNLITDVEDAYKAGKLSDDSIEELKKLNV